MKREIIIRWLKKAESDLKSANILLNSETPPTDMIVFHCQQAIEKYLKAYLTNENVKAGKTHDLQTLLEMCLKCDKDFEILDKEKISQLSLYAVEIRYPEEFFIPTIKEARESFNFASQVKKFIFEKLKINENEVE